MSGLRIAIADDELDMREYFASVLPALGHTVVTVAADGRELVERCREARPELIITDIKMPHLDGIDAAIEICRDGPLPVILVSGYYDAELIRRAEDDHALAYLLKPIDRADLEPAIALAVRRFRELEALRHETLSLRQALEERKLVERAKGLIMRRTGLDESAAFQRLQRLASDRNLRLAEVARAILTAEDAFFPER